MHSLDSGMKKMMLTAALVMFTSPATAVNNLSLKPSFAELVWYSTKSAVNQQLTRKGYIFERNSQGNGTIDSVYSGKLSGIPVTITNWFNDKDQLVKTGIVVKTSASSNLYSNWNALKDNIDTKYGNGIDISNANKSMTSYDSGTEYELKSGKTISKMWLFPTYNYSIGVLIDQAYNNDDSYYVILSYESPAWPKELIRRSNNNDF